jgi:ribonuclease Z
MDHVGGLANFIACRNSARGDKEKPLNIYFPEREVRNSIFAYLKDRFSNLSYSINLIPCKAGDSFDVGAKKRIHVIELVHGRTPCNGYIVREKRSRLKAEFKGRESEIKDLIKQGIIVNEPYIANLFSYTLDAYSFNASEIANSDIWVADCTFLEEKDREDNTHTSLTQCLDIAHRQNIKMTMLAHISSRYFNSKDLQKLNDIIGNSLVANKARAVVPKNIVPIVY